MISGLQKIIKRSEGHARQSMKNGQLSFERENSLVERIALSFGQTPGVYIAREFDSLHGIADLVFFRTSSAWDTRQDLAKVPSNWAYLLKVLPYRKSMSFEYFWGATHASKTTARKLVDEFCSAGFFERNKQTQKITKIRQPMAPLAEIVAIEVKLTKWRSALEQARRYKHFAHKSWVFLDATSIKSAEQNIDLFSQSGVGLATCNQDGDIVKLVHPRRCEPKTKLLYWRANVELSRRLVS